MRLIGFCGWSGSGKTTLLTRLIPLLTARGLRVSTIKHTHHDFEIDKPGKDSWAHRQAGAREVLLASNKRLALIQERDGEAEPGLPELLGRLAPADLVLVEGFRREACPRIEVHRPELGKPMLAADDPGVIAVASPTPPVGLTVPWLPLDAPEVIADFILALPPMQAV